MCQRESRVGEFEQYQRKVNVVHRAAFHGGLVHAVYERWEDGGVRARCGVGFVCESLRKVPINGIGCRACKIASRGHGVLADERKQR